VLREFRPADLDFMYEIHSNESVVRFLLNEVRTRPEVEVLLERKIAGAAISHEGQWLSAAVISRETGDGVGDASLEWSSEAHRLGEIGFIIHPAYHGRGYAVEAARPLLRFAFETLELHRVIGRCEARNAASARVLQKLGMRQEGHLIENEWIKGEWQSELIYAMLASEWASRAEDL
jgi:RimJ/RimL family protein N-acetyltransferase